MNQITSSAKLKINFQKKRQSNIGHANSRNMKWYVKKEHSPWFAVIKPWTINYDPFRMALKSVFNY